MKKGTVSFVAAALLFAPAGLSAQSSEYEELAGQPKPLPTIPPAWRGIVSAASPDVLLVEALGGGKIEVDISWYEPEEFESFFRDRYLGFSYVGHEAYGYILVDRAMAGKAAVFDTGQRPEFSRDGRYIAAAEMSEAGFGNLHGVALWEILPASTVPRFFTDAVPFAWDWRVDRWVRPGCASISAIGHDVQLEIEGEWSEEEWAVARARAPRQYYALTVDDAAISLRAAYDRPGCEGDG